ncbi:hypothetical protein [Emticicia sp. BO119]|uniref:hypothetical protein n=1 Tax=Emticicia sp. BO119 TaxID=2757768 RepID=UPI0015F05291|nr:hypothetical protein [Emticicia sp. BO119]MBA4851977.1 hypothetical protein [Emticicia sp. BO119]
MKKKKVRTCKELAYIKVTGSSRAVFKRVIGYTYQQIVSEFVKITGAKTFPEKVTNMVGTFLKKESMIAKLSKM